jgi:hypothetical protein
MKSYNPLQFNWFIETHAAQMVAVALVTTTLFATIQPVHAQSHLPELTISGDAFLQGSVFFGALADVQGGAGFSIQVTQQTRDVETEVWVPGGDPYQETTWVDEWGWVDGGYYEDIYEYVTSEFWVSTGGYTEWVGTGAYDDDGNEIMTENWVESGGYYETTTESYWVGSNWVSDGGYWAVTGSSPEVTWVYPEGHWGTQVVQVAEAPIVEFTAKRPGTVWKWSDSSLGQNVKTIMEVSSGGLSFPQRGDEGWKRRSYLNDTEVRLSMVTDIDADPQRQAFGTTLTKAGIAAWAEEGGVLSGSDRIAVPDASFDAKLEPEVLHLSRSYVNEDGIRINKTTRLHADHAEFSGSVSVHGVIRIMPAGDVGMGQYANGPQP